jgi:glycoside/pentoside/hexuronide:cation symporter, GPH family
MASGMGSRRSALVLRAINRNDAINYAMGSFGTGVFSTVPAVLLLYFCTETLNISGSIAALLIVVPKLWSIIWDPFVGGWSDQSTHIWGRRRPFMVVGIIGMVVAFVTLFNVPALTAGQTIAWVGISYFALAMLYSLFAVPYIAIPAEVSDDQSTLARLVSWRMVMVMIGILAGAAGAPMLVEAGGGGRAGYGLMGWTIGVLCFIAMSLPLIMLHDRDRPAGATLLSARTSFAADMFTSLANMKFRNLSMAYLAQAIAFGSFSAIVPYAVTKGFGKTDAEIGTALGVYLLATTFSVPFWSWLGKQIGLWTALKWAALCYGLGTCGIGLAIFCHLDWSIALCLLVVAGIPFAGLQVLPFTMVGDVIRAEAANAEGRFTGIWTAVEKLGLALGAVLVGETIDLVQGDFVSGISVFMGIVPLALCLVSMLFLNTIKEPT